MISSVRINELRWWDVPLLLMLVMIASLARGGERRGPAHEFEPRLTLKADKPCYDFSLAFSPDGKTIAFTDGKGGMKLWNLVKNQERMALNKTDEEADWYIYSLAFSPDGKTIALGCCTDVVRMLDIATGKEKRVLISVGINSTPTFVAFAPDGKTLAAGGWGEEVILWDLESRKVRAKLTRHYPTSVSASFTPDSKILATSAWCSDIRLWQADTGKQCGILNPDKDPQLSGSVVFAPDGRTLACGGKEGIVAVWDVGTCRLTATLGKLDGTCIPSVAFSPDGRTLAAVDERGVIHLWEVLTKMERATIHGPAKKLPLKLKPEFRIAFSPDGRTLAAACIDGSIKLWDLAAVKVKQPDEAEMDRLWSALQGHDAIRAYRAIRTLTAFPRQSLPWLRKHVRPDALSEALRRRIDRWLTDLDSDDYARRQKASAGLEKCGVLAEGALRRALAARPSLELRKRASAILEAIERQKAVVPLQQLRGVEVLEHIGTAEARALLRELAKGVPESRLTQEAKASLARLAKRPAATP